MKQEDILKLFRDSGALLNGHFLLTSGRHSNVYYEKFALLKNPAICTEICSAMAEHFRDAGAVSVVGPTTGGIIIAYDVARYLGVQALYAEQGADGEGRVFKRGFSLHRGEKVIIVDDVLTTGRSVKEVITLVSSYGAEIVGLGLLLDRSNGKVDFPYPSFSLARVDAESWDPSDCPQCQRGEPLTQRGSRKSV
jgi:orotate phosphoribosyltransferase